MAGAKKAASDYLEQTRSYDAGSPRTSVPDEQRKKKGFQPAENVGMPMPSYESRPAVDFSAFKQQAGNLQKESDLFRSAADAPPAKKPVYNSQWRFFTEDSTGGFKESIFNQTVGAFFRKTGGLPPDFFATRGGYDETSWRNPKMPRPTSNGQPAVPTPGPAQLAAAESAPASRVNLGGKTPLLTNTAVGGVGIFDPKGNRMDPSGLTGKMGKMGTLDRDFTGQAALDQNVFEMAMARAKDGTLPGGFFTGPREPGPGTYGENSESMQLRNRRDLLQSRVDQFNRSNSLGPNASVGDIISNAAATKQMRDEIKALDTQIFGRTELSNKIMQALIGKDATLQAQMLENQGGLDKQLLENQGVMDVRKMMETEEGRRHLQTILFGGKTTGMDKDPLINADIDFRKSSGLEMLKYMKENGKTPDEISAFISDYSLKNFGRPRNEKEEDQKRISGI